VDAEQHERDESPADVNELVGLRRGPTLWLAEHRVVFCCLLVGIAGVLGYLDALGGTGTQAVGPGIPGLL
jgi:hypothetical protein